MQGRVSIVIPCYNKDKYIGAMLDSVIAQRWDNIELVIVNDGSTDGTFNVIKSYLPKLDNRGFEVKLINQENGGACNAVYNGLQQITGDYLALIDADDELTPEYVSTMAGWLEEHDDCEYCSCDFVVRGNDGVAPFEHHPMYMNGQYSLELFLSRNTNKAAWNFMVRTSYFNKCKILNNYIGLGQCSYEPGFCIPLAAYGGNMKAFDVPLYIYNNAIGGMSSSNDRERYENYCNDYYQLSVNALNLLPSAILSEDRKLYYLKIVQWYWYRELFYSATKIRDCGRTQFRIFDEMFGFAREWLALDITLEQTFENEFVFIQAVEAYLINMVKPIKDKHVIGYGVLGKRASEILPKLVCTDYLPTEIWDEKGNGYRVKKPRFEALTDNDVLIVFPTNKQIVEEVRLKVKKTPAIIYYGNEINYLLAAIQYPQLERAFYG